MTYVRHPHQVAAFAKIVENIENNVDRFQVIFPTGGGKTNTQIDTIRYCMEYSENPLVIVVLAPRIQLCIQHMEEHYLNPLYEDQQFHPMAVHSGNADITEEWTNKKIAEHARKNLDTQMAHFNQVKNASVVCTTYWGDIKQEYERMQAMNSHMIIFATYHSADEIGKSGIPVDLIIADEAHNMVTNGFTQLHDKLTATQWIFFTATQRVTTSFNGFGMENYNLFGPVAYQAEASDLIASGILVQPGLHTMYATGLRTDGVNIKGKKRLITDGERVSNFKAVKELIKEQAALTTISPKILVACKDADEVIFLSKKFASDEQFTDWTVFEVTSKAGNNIRRNDTHRSVKRAAFIDAVKECKTQSLIFHYDILSEGIDVDGISGVVFLRDMSYSKILQTIGRALRPQKHERNLPIEMRQKKTAWISVPLVSSDEANNEDYASIRETLVSVMYALIEGGLEKDKVHVHTPRSMTEDTDDGVDPAEEPEVPVSRFNDLFDLSDIMHEIMQREFDAQTGMMRMVARNIVGDEDFSAFLDT